MRLEPRNPMAPALLSVLIFEAIICWLAFPGMLQIADAPLGPAVGATVVVSLLCIAAAAGLRKSWGYPLAWVAQAGVILLGFLTPWMFAMGIIFAIIWTISFVLGKRIEDRKRETP
ncbi:DUF4233 domain-containing protein [Tessaracoccus oleiagri]|uniref:DUF4233 domain-containing protein n=1 Tax=Tessaracoccus oleiagri TaxID=686624 RepID=A0A1G9JAM1_9ACTN|nr:DUF4233 domain-containing protein [Tessaracoccus oleiagri]SDL34184.1 Protein of unknown function [Tessaracoccus oleiagri]